MMFALLLLLPCYCGQCLGLDRGLHRNQKRRHLQRYGRASAEQLQAAAQFRAGIEDPQGDDQDDQFEYSDDGRDADDGEEDDADAIYGRGGGRRTNGRAPMGR